MKLFTVRQIAGLSITLILVIAITACGITLSPGKSELSMTAVHSASITPWSETPHTQPTQLPIYTPIVATAFTVEAIRETPEPSRTIIPLLSNFSQVCQDAIDNRTIIISPDGNWLAEYCFAQNVLQVINRDGTIILRENLKDFYYKLGYPDDPGYILPVHWTKDSHYVYFVVSMEGWGEGGPYTISGSSPNLFRMSVPGGKTGLVVNGNFYYSFSPTDRHMIEIQEYKRLVKLIIHDIYTGSAETLIPIGRAQYCQAGSVVWSPDGKEFVFVAASNGKYSDNDGGDCEANIQSLILVDMSNFSQQLIIPANTIYIVPVSWDKNDLITYKLTEYINGGEIVTTYVYDAR